jgi:outer membrane protein TolC
MINNCSFAKEIIKEEDLTTTMTIDEAIEYAIKHNPNVVDIGRQAKDQKELYDDAKDTYRFWQYELKSGGYSFETPQEYFDCHGHSLELADLAYKSFLATKGTIEQTVAYNVRKLAYSIDELEKNIEVLEKTVIKQENDLKIAKVKNNLNMITILDVTSSQIALSSTKLQLESLKTTLKSLRVNLMNLMGYDISKELAVTIPEQEIVILDVENLSEIIDQSLETNGDAITAKINYKQKEMNNILATNTSWIETSEERRNAKRDFSDAEARLNNSLNYIKENLYSLYNQVKFNEESVIISKQEYDQLKIKYNQMKVMSDLGMVTKHDFNSYEIALINARNTYEAELHKNILLNERWNIAILVGDVIAKQEA